jgi:hypothetical protein
MFGLLACHLSKLLGILLADFAGHLDEDFVVSSTHPRARSATSVVQ